MKNNPISRLLPTMLALVVVLLFSACSAIFVPLEDTTPTAEIVPGTLELVEFEIQRLQWKGEILSMVPVEGTAEEILALHEAQRSNLIPRAVYATNNIRIAGDEISYRIHETIAQGDSNLPARSSLEVLIHKNGELLVSIPIGTSSPISPVWGFWAYPYAWFLEVAYSETIPSTDDIPNNVEVVSTGDIFENGISLNAEAGYEESFGFQILAGRPFYFYKRAGVLGYAYDGTEFPLEYTRIDHHNCCSGAALNPVMADNMVAFYAYKGDVMYYAEIGVFD